MQPGQLSILFEDNHLLAVVKPAGLPTMGTAAGKPTLLTLAKQYVKDRYQKPGNVYLGIMSRLDAPVTGVVLLARTSKAAARLTEQFRSRSVEKTYWAIVEGILDPPVGTCSDWIGQDHRSKRMRIVEAEVPGAKQATLTYRRLSVLGKKDCLVEVELQTGRKHQIRLQLAALDHAILGDFKYGSRRPFPAGIALHARRLVFKHPVKGDRIELVAPIPAPWRAFGVDEEKLKAES